MEQAAGKPISERLSRLLGAILVAFAIAGLAVGAFRELRASPDSVREDIAAAHPKSAIVYYFHGHTRCDTCLAIERQTSDVVHRVFADDLASGRLVFVSLDFDEPRYLHYREKFILSFGAVVVARPGDGEWECLNDVWTLIDGEPDAFDEYVVNGVRSHLPAARPAS
jgi:hypothetical protein